MWWLLLAAVPAAVATLAAWLSGPPPARGLPSDETLLNKIKKLENSDHEGEM